MSHKAAAFYMPDLAELPTLACDKAGSLLSVTRKLVKRETKTRSRTALASSLGIPIHWLNALMQGDIDAPSVNRIQFIYEKLSGSKLDV